jgi:hypothetical protein
MRRILLSCATLAVLVLPAAASAGAREHTASQGFLVVQRGVGAHGHPVVTLVVEGFFLGRISTKAQAQVDIYHLPLRSGEGAPQVIGSDVSHHPVRWRSHQGIEYNGSGFRFSAINGAYRIVVRGTGVYLFAGGRGSVTLRGSSFSPQTDGTYSIDDAAPRSLPTRPLSRKIGGG